MERVEFHTPRKVHICANFWPAKGRTITILIHGYADDKTENGRFAPLSKEIHKKGTAVMAFDFSGCGESGDDTITIAKEVEDLNSAMTFAKALGYKEYILHGHSLGGLIALKAYNPRVKTIILTASVTNKSEQDWKDRLSKEELQELKTKGFFTKIRSKQLRTKMLVDKEFAKERNNINQKQVLAKIKCPVLLIHGDKDTRIPIKDSKNAVKLLPKGSKLVILKGAGHDLIKENKKVAKLITAWIKKHSQDK